MSKAISLEEAQERLFQKHNKNIEMKNYIGISNFADFKCLSCGREWTIIASAVLTTGHGCWVCNHRDVGAGKEKISKEEVEKRIFEKHGDSITLLEYNGAIKSIGKFQCNNCPNSWYTMVQNVTKGHGCRKCSMRNFGIGKISPIEDVKLRLFNLHGNDVSILEYSSIVEFGKFKCNICGNQWDAIVNSVIRRSGCPICNESSGERLIRNFLENNNIAFIRQCNFGDCKNEKYLFFDFYLPEYNCCIEYQGEQHYKSVEFFGGEEGFEKTKKRDNIKKEYCIKKEIIFLIIDYDQNNEIENIIKNSISI